MMLSRNSLSHMYDKTVSRNIYGKIKEEYIKLFEELQEKI